MRAVSKVSQGIVLARLASAPTNPIDGMIYYNTTTNKMQLYSSGAWGDIGDASAEIAAALANYYTKAEIDSIVSGLASVYIAQSEKGAANGVATLDSNSTIPLVQIPDLTGGYIPQIAKGVANGVATLDANAKLNPAQIPAMAITDTFVVADEAAMLALDAQTGDIAIRSDESKTYILQGSDPTVLGNWVMILTPATGVLSVNSKTGVVVLETNDIQVSSSFSPVDSPILAADSITTALSKAQGQIETKLTHLYEDTDPALNANLKTGPFAVTGTDSAISFGAGLRQHQAVSSTPNMSEYIESEFVPKADYPSAPDLTVYTLLSQFKACEVLAVVKTQAGEVAVRKLLLFKNNTDAFINEVFADSAAISVSFDVELSGSDILLKMTNDEANSVTLVLYVKKFLMP